MRSMIEMLIKRSGIGACALILLTGGMSANRVIAQDASAPAAEAAPATEAAPAPAAPAPPAPLTGDVNLPGVWTMTVETPDGTGSTGEMTITNGEDGTLAAVWVTDLGTATFPNVAVDGNGVKFSAEVDFGGVMVPIKFEGSTGGDAIQGIVSLEFDGQPLALPAKGVRGAAMAAADGATTGTAAAAPLTGEVNLPGEWEFNATLPDGSVSSSSMTVTEENGGLVAQIQTELGEAKIDGINVDGNMIDFATEIDMGGVMVPLSFKGSSGGDKLQGAVSVNMDGQEMVLPIAGTRKGAGDLTGDVNLPGLWDMAAQLPDGSTSGSSLTIREKDGGIVAVLETEIGQATIEGVKVDGNAVTFDTQIDMGGVLVPMSFVGSTGGDKIKGTVKLNMDGQEMALPISGTRTGDAPAETAAPAGAAAPEAAPADAPAAQ